MGIIEGVINTIDKKATIETMAESRLNICGFCLLNKNGICAKSWCVLKFKTRSKSENCPIGKW